MEKTYKRVPFDIELAKKIQSGEIEGRIVTQNGAYVRLLCTDRSSSIFPIVGLIGNYYIYIFTKSGVVDSNGNDKDCLLIELPEETPKTLEKVLNKMKDSKWDGYFEGGNTDCGQSFEDACVKEAEESSKQNTKALYAIKELLSMLAPPTDINTPEKFNKAMEYLAELTKKIEAFKNFNTSKHEFKPFDKVLVRDSDGQYWVPRLFEIYSGGTEKYYCQDGAGYVQCIPFAGNEYLVGTTNNPE